MTSQYRLDYKDLSVEQIIALILAEPHNEEAAAYLLYVRYNNLLRSVYNGILRGRYNEFAYNDFWFDDCATELYLHLRGKDGDWRNLATLQNRSSFGSWLKSVARRKFIPVLRTLIENNGSNISLDNEDPEQPPIQLPSEDQDNYERRELNVQLLEAIGRLADDYRFVILKRLQGYNSKEIATMLGMKWKNNGIKKYNNNNEPVVPDAAYVDNLTARAKKELKRIINE